MFDHLSPAHANAFLCRRSQWFRRYVLRRSEAVGAKAHRGTAVEAGIYKAVTDDAGMDAAIDEAMELYNGLAVENADREEVGYDIPRLVEAGVEAMAELIAQHGRIAGYQRKLKARLLDDGMEWLGYTDFTMEDGVIVDCKVAGRSPSAIGNEWGRAAAFYSFATDGGQTPVKFLALTPLKREVKISVLTATDHAAHLDMLRDIERDVMRVTRLIETAGTDAVAPCFAPNPDDYWNKEAA